MKQQYRIGLIVPSSNTTMETELPELFRRREATRPERFTFHASRVRLQHVTKESLTEMVSGSDRCAVELADARVDVMAYACLVAIMTQGSNYHEEAERQLEAAAAGVGASIPVVSSAGALVRAARALGYSRVALVAPYLEPLTRLVCDYLEAAGVTVVDRVSLEIADNLAVGRHDPERLPQIAQRLDITDADCVVLSACVQMPSLPAIERAEQLLGRPVLSAATATAWAVLDCLGLTPAIPSAGALLSGRPPAMNRA